MHLEINAAGAQGIKKDIHRYTHTKPIRKKNENTQKKKKKGKGKGEGQLGDKPFKYQLGFYSFLPLALPGVPFSVL